MLALVQQPAKYIDTADVAKMVRKALAVAFPGVKFSVKSSRYSGGSSIRVNWTDGPTAKMVDAVVGHMHGSDFDGMTDCRTNRPADFVDGVGLVKYGNDFIFTNRDLSDAFVTRVTSYVERNCGAGGRFEHENNVYRTARRAFVVAGLLHISKDY